MARFRVLLEIRLCFNILQEKEKSYFQSPQKKTLIHFRLPELTSYSAPNDSTFSANTNLPAKLESFKWNLDACLSARFWTYWYALFD
ncbi:hypothetical protein BpHYR1_047052 [Brachionus plicatilis]|uniref:Uncharacterized protein n=1 Tax=Brachionus plicatilis TaxID=10195 RepID=A0A3M7RXQ1_BRAPC|nr:hypothetical protein BpHYR1_047052 [Brachionus plicatilis]